ncbi:hypothetical protein HDU67_009798 [Dinochytrium kinnereticum]|nr:hypothetical protein HDU67_009798 [Dinochytrium kinnereticum]
MVVSGSSTFWVGGPTPSGPGGEVPGASGPSANSTTPQGNGEAKPAVPFAILGPVVGVALAIAIGLAVFFWRRASRKQEDQKLAIPRQQPTAAVNKAPVATVLSTSIYVNDLSPSSPPPSPPLISSSKRPGLFDPIPPREKSSSDNMFSDIPRSLSPTQSMEREESDILRIANDPSLEGKEDFEVNEDKNELEVQTQGPSSSRHPIMGWTPSDVHGWMESSGVKESISTLFFEHNIDGPTLLKLTDVNLAIDLGIDSVHLRTTILLAIDDLVQTPFLPRRMNTVASSARGVAGGSTVVEGGFDVANLRELEDEPFELAVEEVVRVVDGDVPPPYFGRYQG